jgi:hypothetical protein
MSTLFTANDAYVPSPAVDDEVPVYRSISRAAVLSPVLALVALLGLIFPSLLALAAAGVLLAIVGILNIRRYPDEYSGLVPAVAGLVLNLVIGLGGATAHAVEYATEVPEGYQRISFVDLNPADRNAIAVPPPQALALDGKKIFIKGYVYPDGQSSGIKRFVMIPDLGTCCFGGQPRLTDMVLVTLRDPHRTVYNQRKRKVIGTLTVNTDLRPVNGVNGVYYQLDAEGIQ